jgi:Fe2+ or Zn2+ uptake regulation protein
MLLKVIRNEGTEKAMQGMSKATYYRQVKKLRELGLLT